MMNKIQVLLIDDLPTFALKKAKDTTLTGIENYQKESDVPFIAEKPYSDFFELKWLQNKEDLQLYKRLCTGIEDNFSALDLGSVEGAVSEIVLFDYALTGHEDASYLSEENDKNLLEQLVPNYKLREYWQKNKSGTDLPVVEKIEINSTQISEGLNVDNIGCIGGIIAVTQFRVHPCIGIAISRKTDANIQGRDVQFLEVLVKEPNQFDFGLRGDISNLKWETLLRNAVKLLRQRIETLIQSNRITLNLTQLLAWASKNPDDDKKKIIKERIFTFQSAYGVRHLPFDGLFIDVEANKRDEAIKEWIKGEENNPKVLGLLGIITSSLPVLKETIKEYEKIYETYKTKFLNRILLSDFSRREKEGDLKSYADRYKELKSIFEVTEGKIGDGELCSIVQVFADKKSGKNSNWTDDDKSKLRLLVLLLCTRLWIDHQKGAKRRAETIPLIKEDYFYILNPVVNSPLSAKKDAKDKNPLLLLMHNPLDNVSDYTDTFGDWLNKKSKNEISRTEWHNFEWITDGEKKIVKSQFQTELSEIKKQPDWLS